MGMSTRVMGIIISLILTPASQEERELNLRNSPVV